MKSLRKLVLAAAAAAVGVYSALATPAATHSTYKLNGNQPYFDDANVSALLPAADNLLRGLVPAAVEGAIRSGYGNNGAYYETQADSPACLTDGSIPTHEDTSNWNKESNARWLVSDNSTLTWTFSEPKNLGDVRLWTQWPDGKRNDIAVSSIQVTTDGSTWRTLPNSAFCSGKSSDNAVVKNSITPALDNSTHFRMVKYADDTGMPLATGITGLRIVFPEQELGYTCFWEIEARAENAHASISFVPSDVHSSFSGWAYLSSNSESVVLRYGIDQESLTLSKTLVVDSDRLFSGELTNLIGGTTYYYKIEVIEGESVKWFDSGSFQTLEYETFGDCAVVNGAASSVGNYAVISFAKNGYIRFEKSVDADILIVGGGGGGGNGGYSGGGGGGAGGVVYRQNVTIAAGEYQVVVGAGGAENEKGGDSQFSGILAYGGGAGNHGYGDPNTTDDGGSGGGACAVSDWAREAGTGTEGQGHDGGLNLHSAVLADDSLETKVVKNSNGQPINGGGGGGGAGAQGGSGSFVVKEYRDDNGTYTAFCDYYYAGNGGDGIACSITGEEVWYGGGGGGGLGGWYRNGSESSGGKGGGGKGGTYNDWAYDGDPTHGYKRDGEDGVNGTGGGGGGGGSNGNENSASKGGRGGDGIVIIRYAGQFSDFSRPATGGNTIVRKRGYLIHTFTEDGEFDIPDSTYVDVLLVGGGGGGGNGYGAAGGGGAGGMLVLQHMTLLAGKYSVTVGAGGLGGIRDREPGGNGGDSVFAGYIAVGGGGGAGIYHAASKGGSGGGAYYTEMFRNDESGAAGTEGQGHDGGSNTYVEGSRISAFGAGGGGAGEAGYSSSVNGPGKGGDGLMCDFSGEEKWYAGGGAGGGNANAGREETQAKGGKGGGGDSGYWPTGVDPVDHYGPSDNMAYVGHAENGTGGGGGGGAIWGNGSDQGPGGNGGSGIVIIRYKHEPVSFGLFVR